jgi:hypothetical protein
LLAETHAQLPSLLCKPQNQLIYSRVSKDESQSAPQKQATAEGYDIMQQDGGNSYQIGESSQQMHHDHIYDPKGPRFVFRNVDWARFDLNRLCKKEHGRLIVNNMIIFRAVIVEIEAAVSSFKNEDEIIIDKF